MKNKLKIDIVSDVVCPWCTIGYKRLEKAISELGIEDQIEIEWQPFELNPNMPAKGQNKNEIKHINYSFIYRINLFIKHNLTRKTFKVIRVNLL